MNGNISRWLRIARSLAFVLLIVGGAAMSSRVAAGPPCAVCQCIGGTGICGCRDALPGEQGWTGACSPTESGCAFGLGEGCDGQQ